MKIYLNFCQNQGSSVCMAVLASMYLVDSVTMGSVVWEKMCAQCSCTVLVKLTSEGLRPSVREEEGSHVEAGSLSEGNGLHANQCC